MSSNNTEDNISKKPIPRLNFLNCVECSSEPPNCPTCSDGSVCHISLRSCEECPVTSCVANSKYQNKSDTNISIIVGLSLAIIFIIGFIIFMIGRRRFRRHKQLFEDVISESNSPKEKAREFIDFYDPANINNNTNSMYDSITSMKTARTRHNSTYSIDYDQYKTLKLNEENKGIRRPESAVTKSDYESIFSNSIFETTSSSGEIMNTEPNSNRVSEINWLPRYYPSKGEAADLATINVESVKNEESYAPKPVLDLDIESLLAIQFYPSQNMGN